MDDAENMVEFAGIGEVAETTTQLLALSLHAAGHSSEYTGGQRARLDPVEQLVLQQARDYLNKVREGFVLSVRSNQVRDRSEIGYLVDRVLIDWEAFSRELGLDEEPQETTMHAAAAATPTDEDAQQVEATDQDDARRAPSGESENGRPNWEHGILEQGALEKVRYQVMAFAMAAVALGFLPRLPAKAITFPHSYSSPPTYADIPVPATAGEMLSRIEEMQNMLWQMMSNDMGHLIQRRYGSVRRTYGFFEVSAWLAKKDAERFGIKRNRTTFSWF